MKAKVKRRASITVGEFFDQHGTALKMRLLGGERGFDRPIREPTINRPGLALAGFHTYFANKRVQVIGNNERAYLDSIDPAIACERLRWLCKRDIPCVVVARAAELAPEMMDVFAKAGIAVFQSPMITMRFINQATIKLEWDFAPSIKVHGSMVDIKGIGILIRGASGLGKSEAVLGLIERGASLVADDLVHLKALPGREIVASSLELNRSHLEVRGIGIINVAALFGVGSMRLEKRLDLIVDLCRVEDINDLDRVGATTQFDTLIGMRVPKVEIPVAPGRDIAWLIEVAALDQKLRSFGHNSALEFSRNLLKMMRGQRIK